MPPSASGSDRVTPRDHLTPKDRRPPLYSACASETSLSIRNPNQTSLDLQSGYYWFFFPVYINLLKKKKEKSWIAAKMDFWKTNHQQGCDKNVDRHQLGLHAYFLEWLVLTSSSVRFSCSVMARQPLKIQFQLSPPCPIRQPTKCRDMRATGAVQLPAVWPLPEPAPLTASPSCEELGLPSPHQPNDKGKAAEKPRKSRPGKKLIWAPQSCALNRASTPGRSPRACVVLANTAHGCWVCRPSQTGRWLDRHKPLTQLDLKAGNRPSVPVHIITYYLMQNSSIIPILQVKKPKL